METSAENLEALVRSTIAKICNRALSEVTPATTLQSLGIDSLTIPAIVARLEASLECEFSHAQTLDFLEAVRVDDIAMLLRRSVGNVSTALA
jgi:acyl carrier protein